MAHVDFRSQFPVLERVAYLNAGTDGPLPRTAVQAAQQELEGQARQGRAKEHFERRSELSESLRASYAEALGCESQDVSLTTCTSEGLAIVIDGLGLREGDEILTSDEEHPGLLGALAAAQDGGVSVRLAPFIEIHEHVGSRTRLIACSHVSWMTGRECPAGLAEVEPPLVLDGAQGVGAVSVNLSRLGCDAYAGAGQKWLCGPDGTGMLYTSPALRSRLSVKRRGYGNIADPNQGLDAQLHEDGRRLDTPALSAETLACAHAAARILEQEGLAQMHTRAKDLTVKLAEMLRSAGREVIEHSAGTLLSFCSPDPEAERGVLAEHGVVLRDIPGRPWLRASVGAWNDERDLQRLIDALP
ncbi:MAG TPA: aminotransferase class V-fold PLP-dependent enzyme [Solirubrobacteraceae bacterium]|nr:aminotransferase class V-fold PLP-dependent enzyme [Solirubrobacteraceae bacterium]